MLAPIVTKDMQLFPSRPLPAHVKNVRTRAQSLKDLPDGHRKLDQKSVQTVKQRHALSTGNLNARSPPKGSVMVKRKPLDSIAEGVELTSNSSTANLGAANLPPVPSSSKLIKKDANGNPQIEDEYGKLIRCPAINLAAAKGSPDQELCSLQELGSRPCSSMSTFSDPSPTNKVEKPKTAGTGLIKLFTSAFKSRPKSRCNDEADSHKKSAHPNNEPSTTVP